ncbi:hypothetical protein HQ585_05585 [candidate division KSB1 bacterium]|nr:hypothetical protein [candidate division KSB1 bacterium]
MKFRINLFTFLILSLSFFYLQCSNETGKKWKKKVIVYAPGYKNLEQWIYKLPYDKITHINYAFVNPDTTMKLHPVNDLSLHKMIDLAHKQDVQVFASLGGGTPESYAKTYKVFLKPDQMDTFISKLIDYAQSYKFDGIDVDIEGHAIGDRYEPFIVALSKACKKENLGLSAALATWNGDIIPDAALDAYDFINVMAYDLTGPWNDKKGPHSPYSFAKESLEYWASRGLPADKIILGVPFYGYDDSSNDASVAHKSFQEIMDMDSTAYMKDQMNRLFYDGHETLKKKVELGNQFGGIMVWEITQDAQGKHGLIHVIYENIDK